MVAVRRVDPTAPAGNAMTGKNTNASRVDTDTHMEVAGAAAVSPTTGGAHATPPCRGMLTVTAWRRGAPMGQERQHQSDS